MWRRQGSVRRCSRCALNGSPPLDYRYNGVVIGRLRHVLLGVTQIEPLICGHVCRLAARLAKLLWGRDVAGAAR
jgi:hypothetical protein